MRAPLWCPEKTNASGITCSRPSRLAPFKTIPSPTFSGIYTARAPFRAVGCTSMCLDKKVCSLNAPVLVSLPCFFLVFCRSDQPAAIGKVRHPPPHRGSVWEHVQRPSHMDPSILPSFLGSQKAAMLKSPPMMSTQFISATSLASPQQRSCDSFPLRCRVAHVH